MDPHWLMRQIECHPASGAYLTLGAILAAIWATWATLSAERKRIEAKGRVIAFRLSPILEEIHADVERALKCADDLAPGTNDFSRLTTLIGGLPIPTKIPDDIFRDTWAMPSAVALFVAQLESALAKYEIVTSQLGLSSIGVMMPDDRAQILTGIRNMLRGIDVLCLGVSNHCTKVAGKAILPFWRRWWLVFMLKP